MSEKGKEAGIAVTAEELARINRRRAFIAQR